MKIYLDDLWPKPGTGGAQVPYFYPPGFNDKLNDIVKNGRRLKDETGRVYFEMNEQSKHA